MTLAEFLAWEERQPERWEFDGFAPVAMTGGTAAHDLISGNVGASLRARLRGGPCRARGPNLKVEVAGRARYPDAFVTCGPVAPGDTVAAEPVVVFEVLSDSTAATDRTEKMDEYRATPSVRRYVMLEQDRAMATVFARAGDGRWVGEIVRAGEALAMPEVGIAALPLDDLYEGVDLATPATAAPPPPG